MTEEHKDNKEIGFFRWLFHMIIIIILFGVGVTIASIGMRLIFG